jgi:hypothetical protein
MFMKGSVTAAVYFSTPNYPIFPIPIPFPIFQLPIMPSV